MVYDKIYSIAHKVTFKLDEEIKAGHFDLSNTDIAKMLETFTLLQKVYLNSNLSLFPPDKDIDNAINTAYKNDELEILSSIYFLCGEIFEKQHQFNISKELYIEGLKILKILYEENRGIYAPYYIEFFKAVVRVDITHGKDTQSAFMNIITCLEEMVVISYEDYISCLIIAYYNYYCSFPKERKDMFDIACMIACDNPKLLVSIDIIKKYKHKYPLASTRKKRMTQAKYVRECIISLD